MLVLAAFMLVLATFVVSFAFVAFTFMLAFVLTFFVALVLAFFVALVLWHVGLHFLHLLCHVDDFSFLGFVEVFPVGEGFDHLIHAAHHLRAWSLIVMIAFMVFFALLFLIFAALFLFAILFVFLFVAA